MVEYAALGTRSRGPAHAIAERTRAKGWNPMADKGPKDTSLQSTKQMLDELDALMERMLSLPVSDQDGAPALPKENTKGPSLAASLTLLDPPVDEPAKTPSAKSAPALKSSPTVATIAAPTAKRPLERRPRTKLPHPPIKPPHLSMPSVKIPAVPPVTEPEPVTSENLPAAEPEPLTNEVVPATSEADPHEQSVADPSAAPPSGRRHGPLLWINQRYDRSTMFLGSLGKLLRGPAGRTLLGLLGIASLLAALGWVLKDWLGWNWQ